MGRGGNGGTILVRTGGPAETEGPGAGPKFEDLFGEKKNHRVIFFNDTESMGNISISLMLN